MSLRTLDLGLLQAGAGVKGEFENRLKSRDPGSQSVAAADHSCSSTKPTRMIGAGGQAGQGDAANLLKPALARGELRTIAATTWAEYKKYFEKDAALARRFQVVKVEEPTEEQAIGMMRGLAATLEKHHNVRILDEAIEDAVRLSHRYITGRQLPDKAVSLLDTACARVAMGHSSTPPALEDMRRDIEQLTVLIEILEREAATGAAHEERVAELTADKALAEERLAELEQRWKEESEIWSRIREIRGQLEEHVFKPAKKAKEPAAQDDGKKGGVGKKDGRAEEAGKGAAAVANEAAKAVEKPKLGDAEIAKLRSELTELETKLHTLQGEQPLMQVCVDSQAVAEVVSGWTGIPVGKMLTDEINTVLTLKERMEERIIGQSHALEHIAQRIRTARANLVDPRRPIGVFLLVGPSGVGKTETAMTLADILYGGERNMVDHQHVGIPGEPHRHRGLKGSPRATWATAREAC